MNHIDDRALKVCSRFRDLTSREGGLQESYSSYLQSYGRLMQREQRIHDLAACPYIIAAHGAGHITCSSGEQLPCMLVELALGGSLDKALRKPGPPTIYTGLPPSMAKGFFKAVLKGLARLHAAGFIHRDVKSGNVLLFGSPEAPLAKLSDLGACKQVLQADDFAACPLPGTLAFRAPEQQPGRFQDVRLDTFLAGLLWLEMRFGILPFQYLYVKQAAAQGEVIVPDPVRYKGELQDLTTYYNRGDAARGLPKLDPEEREFVIKCLEPDLSARPPPAWLLQHIAYLQGP
jgi:serine/threonine protein kinase